VEPLGERDASLSHSGRLPRENGSGGLLILGPGARILGSNLPGKFDLQVSF